MRLHGQQLHRAKWDLPPYTVCTRTAALSAAVSESTLCLVEEDIPGASFTEPFESYTVTELSWWLLCRGISAPKSQKKAQVSSR